MITYHPIKVRFECRDGVLEYEKRFVVERSAFMADKIKLVEKFCHGPCTICYEDFSTEVINAYLSADLSIENKQELLSFLEHEGKQSYSGSGLKNYLQHSRINPLSTLKDVDARLAQTIFNQL